MEKKISIIIPVYNAEKFIKRCLLSAINQTYKNLEIICIDDGSNDDSSNIIEELAQIVMIIWKKTCAKLC